jgi:hypothetical protein
MKLNIQNVINVSSLIAVLRLQSYGIFFFCTSYTPILELVMVGVFIVLPFLLPFPQLKCLNN